MHDERTVPQDDEPAGIADVRRLPLDVLLDTDDSALANALRRVLRDLSQPGENYAAHSTAPHTPHP